jgi:DNA-binding protein H-NS
MLLCVRDGESAAAISKPKETSMRKGKKQMAETVVSDVDLDQMSEQEVMELIKAALEHLPPNARRREKEAEVKETLLTEFRERAMQMGLSFDALFGARRTRIDAGVPLTPKYRGPGGEVWSGRGRQPRWLTELEATGHDREEFRIKEEPA